MIRSNAKYRKNKFQWTQEPWEVPEYSELEFLFPEYSHYRQEYPAAENEDLKDYAAGNFREGTLRME